ncbi:MULTISPECIES: alkene reductase [Kitasatospora]|uniref:Putative oxidoreductase n=1 Tax=Kitasatospora setae (strain ATCC 33774 / DSM 43861 / JCM 3304 / KCC A-0304 / NBRC 14216 / KM-6054) TaxID=452652 RepID=E4N4G8_KITSK|nr:MULTISPECIES: alkene reductase [Kitasatospora]BAJ26099.1 putative oxidoreductase [Kitasatospora setae KM-6054]
MSKAFEPYELGGKRLANRLVMAPMTRARAYGAGQTTTPLMAEYYAQRASAGLIITEAAQPSVIGQGYPDTPGIHTAEQSEAWRQVTDAVHAAGGVVFLQIMHVGRAGHVSIAGLQPVGPSAVTAVGQVYTAAGPQERDVPRELTDDEVHATVADFAAAARHAIAAGFDGVEIHGANGYLVHQFLAPNSNLRTDAWGGSPEARIRFAVETARAVAEAVGGDKVGFRLSPGNPLNDIDESDAAETEATYTALVEALAPLGLAYLHQMEAAGQRELTDKLRKSWPGTYILNPFTGEAPTGPDELALIEDGTTDLLAYGAMFLANPDLPARLAQGGPYNAPDFATLFGGDGKGLTDYPTLAEAGA